MNPTPILYTIGHSDRSLDELLELLLAMELRVVVDIRANPRSRRYPHFNQAELQLAIGQIGLGYHWAGRQLGGLRSSNPRSPHIALPEELRGFADYMGSESFQVGATQLTSLAHRVPTTLLCAEREPEHCHRSLISDYLTLQGLQIIHFLSQRDYREHRLSPWVRRESATLIYDRTPIPS